MTGENAVGVFGVEEELPKGIAAETLAKSRQPHEDRHLVMTASVVVVVMMIMMMIMKTTWSPRKTRLQ